MKRIILTLVLSASYFLSVAAYAQTQITSADIKNNTITSADIKNGVIAGAGDPMTCSYNSNNFSGKANAF
jgi:hypothetical protein